MVAKATMQFMSWVQGCRCHEQELREGTYIGCPTKGCRARELEGQVADLEARVPKGRKPPKEKVEAQPGDFYGGWTTSWIEGRRIKGAPGTMWM